jgi:N-acetylglucosamine-6-phosphate deacetylase
MLGVQGIKGTLDAGADADLVVLSERVSEENGGRKRELVVDEVWKFGVRIFERGGEERKGRGKGKGEGFE